MLAWFRNHLRGVSYWARRVEVLEAELAHVRRELRGAWDDAKRLEVERDKAVFDGLYLAAGIVDDLADKAERKACAIGDNGDGSARSLEAARDAILETARDKGNPA